MKSLQGHLLVATPDLLDPNFVRTVVLLIQHTSEGALGVILNRPTNVTIQQAWEKIRDAPCVSREVLRFGGPCEGPLMAIHTQAALSQMEVVPGVFFSGDADTLEELVSQEEAPVRYFVGNAGWGEGQLERELTEKAWLTLPAKVEHVFASDHRLWDEVNREIASAQLVSALKIKHVPGDPSVN